MINKKTVFIVGAGASKELNLPIGSELTTNIGHYLRLQTTEFRTSFAEQSISEYLSYASNHAMLNHDQMRSYFAAARLISASMPIAPSIDNFLDIHQADSSVVELGKLAIAHSILQAERSSKIWFSSDNIYENMNLSAASGTWLQALWHALTTSVSRSNVSQIFNNVAFIVFNYDRCLELFLQQSLQTYFNLQAAEAKRITDNVQILHPYGSIGPLAIAGCAGTSFGAKQHGDVLRAATTRIRTFTETNSFDETVKQDMHASLIDAEKLVFLGFSYGAMNLALLSPITDMKVTKVFGTSLDISRSDISIIQQRIVQMARCRPVAERTANTGVDCNFFPGTCASMMREFSLSIGE